jgi:hypothetical protein
MVSLHVYIICRVEGKGVGMYNFKYCEIKFEFVNIEFKYKWKINKFKGLFHLKANELLTHLS